MKQKKFFIEPGHCDICGDNLISCLRVQYFDNRADYSSICLDCISDKFFEYEKAQRAYGATVLESKKVIKGSLNPVVIRPSIVLEGGQCF